MSFYNKATASGSLYKARKGARVSKFAHGPEACRHLRPWQDVGDRRPWLHEVKEPPDLDSQNLATGPRICVASPCRSCATMWRRCCASTSSVQQERSRSVTQHDAANGHGAAMGTRHAQAQHLRGILLPLQARPQEGPAFPIRTAELRRGKGVGGSSNNSSRLDRGRGCRSVPPPPACSGPAFSA